MKNLTKLPVLIVLYRVNQIFLLCPAPFHKKSSDDHQVAGAHVPILILLSPFFTPLILTLFPSENAIR